jgi:F-box and leucine-rich repeat protein 14
LFLGFVHFSCIFLTLLAKKKEGRPHARDYFFLHGEQENTMNPSPARLQTTEGSEGDDALFSRFYASTQSHHHRAHMPTTMSTDFHHAELMAVDEMQTQIVSSSSLRLDEVTTVPYSDVADLFRKHLPVYRLRKLSLVQSMKVTDVGITNLAGTLKRLKHLDVAGCFKITLGGVGRFVAAGGVQLTHLDLNCWNLSVVLPAQLLPLFNLQHLSFAHCSGVIRDMKHLALLSKLRHLDLSEGTGVTNEELACIATISPLEHLNISFCGIMISDEGMTHVGTMWNLVHLDVTWCTAITDVGVAQLKQLRRLQHLNVACCEKITDLGVQSIGSFFPQLRHLDLCGLSTVTDVGLASIAGSCSELRFIGLGALELITDDGLAHVGTLAHLRHLDISSCARVSDAGLVRLALLSELSYLDVSSCERISNVGLKRLVTSARKIIQLRLPGCVKVTDAGAASVVSNLRLLQFLDLQDCPAITEAGIAQLGTVREYQRHLAAGASNASDCGVVTVKFKNEMHLLHPTIHHQLPTQKQKKVTPVSSNYHRTNSSLRVVASRGQPATTQRNHSVTRKASSSSSIALVRAPLKAL